VSPASLAKAIGDLKQWEALRARHALPEHVSNHDALEKDRNTNTDTASHGAPERALSDAKESQKGSATEPATARYFEQLEKRIDEKDDVIVLLKGQRKG
jgi:hypothetical protein